MTTKLIVGPVGNGLKKNVLPFNIDDDAFAALINAYQWRGRVKRKRGNEGLGRLTRSFGFASIGVTTDSPWLINTIFTQFTPPVVPEANGTIAPGSVQIIVASVPVITFTDNGDGTLSGTKTGMITNATQANPCEITSTGHTLTTGDVVRLFGIGGMIDLNGHTYTITVVDANNFTLNGVDSTGFPAYTTGGEWTSQSADNFGTINYLTGLIHLDITAPAGSAATATFGYFPDLPVMGLEDFEIATEEFPLKIAFDTIYSYNVLPVEPYSNYSVSYYKNPSTDSVNLPGYVAKTTWTPISWNGQDYQQFWSTNYQGALWATNGITIPFLPTNVGMQFAPANTITYVSNAATTLTLTITNCPLVIGDFVFLNEWTASTPAAITSINYQSGYVTAVSGSPASLTVTITLPFAALTVTTYAPGIVQYLTTRSDVTKDCIRWYDGDPTDGVITSPGFKLGSGWVNFMPPLSQSNFSIGDAPARQYYLVGARMLVPFKDRLVILGPVIQTSSPGSQIYLQDTIIYSQNGTPYYTASFQNDPTFANTTFHSILVPTNQTATAPSWFEDQTGFGGNISAGLDEKLNTVGSNEDVLILGFDSNTARMVYTGNDIVPFNLFIINSELGSTSTFSVINMDQGVLARGNRGYTNSSQTASQRIDISVPDEVFQIANVNNGTERMCAQRDFINEWVYFTYPSNKKDMTGYRFPTETLFYNYRDASWAIFNECFTTYGAFRKQTGFTWATVGNTYPTWADWNDPWDAGQSTLLQQTVIAGNQQGFLFIRAQGTGEPPSLYIKSISGNFITSPDHCLTLDDYIIISGVLGTEGAEVNGNIYQVVNPTLNSFSLDPAIQGLGTYFGGGVIKRMSIPMIQTKQFPTGWGVGKKTRIGVQRYLLTKTAVSQITLQIFLSMDNSSPYNAGPIVPDVEPENNALIYSQVLYTCPESTNLGLSPSNVNLQQLNKVGSNGSSSNSQQQIWHRINTSLLGDTIQLGFTLSDEQMRAVNPDGSLISQEAEIELHGFILDVSPSMELC